MPFFALFDELVWFVFSGSSGSFFFCEVASVVLLAGCIMDVKMEG